MAFLTLADIAGDLPTSIDSGWVPRVLLGLKLEFQKLGLVFEAPSITEQNPKGEADSYNQMFNFTLCSEIGAVVAKSYDGTTARALTLNSEYELLEHPNLAGNYYGITTRNRLYPGEYLGVTAKWGCFINFLVPDEKADLLKSIVVDYVAKSHRYRATNFQQISRSKTGDVDVAFRDVSNSTYFSSVLEDPEFASSLSYFKTIALC